MIRVLLIESRMGGRKENLFLTEEEWKAFNLAKPENRLHSLTFKYKHLNLSDFVIHPSVLELPEQE